MSESPARDQAEMNEKPTRNERQAVETRSTVSKIDKWYSEFPHSRLNGSNSKHPSMHIYNPDTKNNHPIYS